MKKLMSVGLIAIFLTFIPYRAEAEGSVNWTSLNAISHDVFHLAKEHHFAESLQLISYYGRQFKKLDMKEAGISYDELRAIAAVHQNAEEALQSKKEPEEKIKAVTQFRLLSDALHSKNEPLWGSMEEEIMTAFAETKKVAEKGKPYQEEWKKFLSLYEMIYPSVSVDVSSDKVKKVDSDIAIIADRQFAGLSENAKTKLLDAAQTDIQKLFEKAKDDEADPSLIWVMISTGSIILLSLSYAGFKKYKGEQQQKQQKKQTEK
ncbi:sporulation protein YpjB [Metabacillus sp. GX 13764]|uniref:sporulation protein YpjB n=1 Tax=Metabacillus kandeliae TaxID=2900151 RepID=UPI001E52B7DC|nr:sporulation protein YpjB [Metabacillus kandeliae]MCD7033385.1 sporulation protein YpjB [Metabacillus kandeliae]